MLDVEWGLVVEYAGRSTLGSNDVVLLDLPWFMLDVVR